MKSYVFESRMMSLDIHFKSQKWKALSTMNNYATHSLKHVDRGESSGFPTLHLINYCFLTTCIMTHGTTLG